MWPTTKSVYYPKYVRKCWSIEIIIKYEYVQWVELSLIHAIKKLLLSDAKV